MFRILAFLALFLGLISTSYGDVIIGNWESSNEGWSGNVRGTYESTITPGCTEGATLGNGSLKVDSIVKPGDFSLDAQTSVGQPGSLLTDNDWWSNNKFAIDISILANNYTPANGSTGNLEFFVLFGAVTPFQSHPLYIYVKVPLCTFDGSMDITQTVIVDYTTVKVNFIAVGCAPGYDSLSITIGHQSDGWAQNDDIYYLDNARLIPEPTAIVLLGLGGLALIRRKK